MGGSLQDRKTRRTEDTTPRFASLHWEGSSTLPRALSPQSGTLDRYVLYLCFPAIRYRDLPLVSLHRAWQLPVAGFALMLLGAVISYPLLQSARRLSRRSRAHGSSPTPLDALAFYVIG